VDWGEDKNQANIKNHGIEFSTVADMFDNPLTLTRLDPWPDEERFRSVGPALNGIVFVVHTIRELLDGNDLYWIISGRYATSHERKAYEKDTD
jgi:uncharacterized protein